MEKDPNDPVMSSGEVARYMRVDIATVNRYAEKGVLPSFRTPGGHRRFYQSDVLTAMEEASHESGS